MAGSEAAIHSGATEARTVSASQSGAGMSVGASGSRRTRQHPDTAICCGPGNNELDLHTARGLFKPLKFETFSGACQVIVGFAVTPPENNLSWAVSP